MPSMGNYLEPGAITRIYDVTAKEVISAVSTRKLPSQMHGDGLIYVDAGKLPEAAKKLKWKTRDQSAAP
ncbi:MAG: hypothetical protein HKN30_11380 [Sulfitobacter sp.]|nr:hypothetical protein [Sulfitobacter sp.]